MIGISSSNVLTRLAVRGPVQTVRARCAIEVRAVLVVSLVLDEIGCLEYV